METEASTSLLTQQHVMESLSRTYVHALAAQARLNITINVRQPAHEFDYGTDGTFERVVQTGGPHPYLTDSGIPLAFQAKASVSWQERGEEIIYKMEVKAYNKLIHRSKQSFSVPMIGILLCLPTNILEWVNCDEERLLLRKCCYWLRLEGDYTENEHYKSVHIPKTQHLTAPNLIKLLELVESGAWR